MLLIGNSAAIKFAGNPAQKIHTVLL